MVRRISTRVIEHKYVVLAIVLIITVFFGLQIKSLVIKTDLTDLFPRSHPFIKTHEKYKDQLGSPFKVFMMLRVKKGDIYNRTTLEKTIRLTDGLDAIPGVNHNHVYSIASHKLKKVRVTKDAIITENLMKEVPASMDQFRDTIRTTPGIFGVWVSSDEKSLLFTAGFIERLMEHEVIFKAVNRLIEEESDLNHDIYAAGEPILMGWVNNYQQEMWLIFGATFLSLFVLLYFYFRNLTGVLVPVSSTVVGGIWGLGFVGLVGYNLEPLVLVIPLLITARALSHAVQITERYFECYQESQDVKQACVDCMSSILPPGTLGIVTDALGILFIAVAPIPIIQKLAYMCGFWAISIVFTGLIFAPLLISLLPPSRNIEQIVDTERGTVQKTLSVMARIGFGRGAIVTLILVIILAVFTTIVASKVNIGDIHPGSPLLWEDSDYNIAIDQINNNFPGTEELYVIIEGEGPDAVETPRFLRILDSFQRHMEDSPLVGHTLSVADFLPIIYRYIYGGHPKWETLPLGDLQSSQIFYRLGVHAAPGDYDLYFAGDRSLANIIVWYKDHMGNTLRNAIATVKEFMEEEKELLAGEKCTLRLASGNIGVLAAINETVQDSQLLNVLLVMSVVFLLCSLTYRSVVAALILMVPLNLTNMITLSIMRWLDIGLNINTLPIVSVGVGVGIDYGIYLLSRLCEEFQTVGEYTSSVATKAIKTTGKAIFFTATTMVIGVIFWYFLSSMKFQAEMGLLLAIIMSINMVGALVVIPTMVYIFRPKFLG
ncbi:MAG: MMPL family transporter, partial [Thermodesulfobacteriota bacterium]|nr:MMPL family transporter [Thermodesulfobacteriota bacterium]